MKTRIFGILATLNLLLVAAAPLTAFSTLKNEGDLRMSSGLASADMEIGSQTSWLGEFDYYVTDWVSLYGDAQVPLQAVADLRPYYSGLGFNFHWLNLGPLDMFTGFGGGLTFYVHPDLPLKAITTMDVSVGAVLFGTVFHVFTKLSYRRSEYFGDGVFYDLNHPVFVAGVGFQF